MVLGRGGHGRGVKETRSYQDQTTYIVLTKVRNMTMLVVVVIFVVDVVRGVPRGCKYACQVIW